LRVDSGDPVARVGTGARLAACVEGRRHAVDRGAVEPHRGVAGLAVTASGNRPRAAAVRGVGAEHGHIRQLEYGVLGVGAAQMASKPTGGPPPELASRKFRASPRYPRVRFQ